MRSIRGVPAPTGGVRPRSGRIRDAVSRSLPIAVLYLLAGGAGHAQWQREGRFPPRFHPSVPTDRSFTFCRLMYTQVRREPMGMGWGTDYPYADVNMMIRLSELTKTRVSFAGPDQPNHYVVRPEDDALFLCPFVMASDAGTIGFSPEEATRLRAYLLKGGMLWVDDFWGTPAWEHWTNEIGKVLPPSQFQIVDVPRNDPIFSNPYLVDGVPQITNLNFFRRTGGSTTSERGEDSAEPRLRAIRDEAGRIMVLMSHNTDIADSWEREGEDAEFFYRFAHQGYAIGINVLVYIMAH